MMNEYKTLAIKTNEKVDLGQVEKALAAIPREDLHCELAGDELIVKLRQVDFRELKQAAESRPEGLDRNNSLIVKEIIKRIERIKSYGLKSGKRLYIGYNRERKVQGRKEKEKTRGPYYYARDHQFSEINREMPGEHVDKILCGDSAQLLAKLPENCVDLVITSPPYNFGLDYADHEDGADWNAYFAKLYSVFDECIRVLKYGGRIIVNVQPLFSDYIPIHHILSNYFMGKKLIWKGEVVWDKHNWNCKYTAWGSWQSPSNPYLKSTWEFLEIFCKGGLKKPGLRQNIDITADEFKKLVIAKWDIAPERNMKHYGHPAMFPEKLVASALKLFSYKGDLILDPFNGVGTTAVVAKRLGRRYLGIDTSDQYCQRAQARLKETQAKTSLFDED